MEMENFEFIKILE